MEMKTRLTPALEMGLMKATASYEAPEVTLFISELEMPTLCVDEAGVIVELSFPDREALEQFQQQVAALRIEQ